MLVASRVSGTWKKICFFVLTWIIGFRGKMGVGTTGTCGCMAGRPLELSTDLREVSQKAGKAWR